MIAGLALLVGGVALYALAGSALSSRVAQGSNGHSPQRTLRLLALALAAALAIACLTSGIDLVDGRLTLGTAGLPLWLCTALCVAPLALLAAGLVLLAVFPPPSGGDDGGSGPGKLPPPPDPDGPDGWAEFEREFRAYAGARDAERDALLPR